MSPEIEASVVNAASQFAIFAVKLYPPQKGERIMPKLVRAFDLAYNAIHLKVEAKLASES